MTEVVASLGELALASRLKRLSERLMQDVSRVYHEQGLDFEPRWFLLFRELGHGGPRSVTELAARIGVTHPAVNQAATEMIEAGLVTARSDARDKRRRLLELTAQGKTLTERLEPIWQEIREATAELIGETGHDLVGILAQVEHSLDRHSMRARVQDRIKARLRAETEILDYAPALRRHFKRLNLAWLTASFTPEPGDLAVLNHPEQEIVKRGGRILFARLAGKVVGTCAVVPVGKGTWELLKMAVDPAYQGRQVGRKLALSAIATARALGARELIARTSPRLEAANQLYRALGFRSAGPDRTGEFRRETILFRLDLRDKPGSTSR